jgi:hypothetical protein
VMIIAGGGDAAAADIARPGGDAAAAGTAAGGDGLPEIAEGYSRARGGSGGVGGSGGTSTIVASGSSGADFDGTTWGEGGAGADNVFSSGGAGYGGGGGGIAASTISAAAGGSFLRLALTSGTPDFRPASNGGAPAATTSARGGAGGNGSVLLTFLAPPAVTTTNATSVTTTSAVISGVVNAHGAETSDLTIKFSTDEAIVNAGQGIEATIFPTSVTGASPTDIAATLSGLTPNTQYFYRVSATNSEGTSVGATLSFRTASITPTPSPPGPAPGPASEPNSNGQSLVPQGDGPASHLPPSPSPSVPEFQAPLMPANPPLPQLIAPGIVLAGVETAIHAQARTMRKAPAGKIGRAPIVRSTVAQPLRLVVQRGLAEDTRVRSMIKRQGGQYRDFGVVQTDGTGVVQLPVFTLRNPGLYVIALSSGDKVSYIKVRARQ